MRVHGPRHRERAPQVLEAVPRLVLDGLAGLLFHHVGGEAARPESRTRAPPGGRWCRRRSRPPRTGGSSPRSAAPSFGYSSMRSSPALVTISNRGRTGYGKIGFDIGGRRSGFHRGRFGGGLGCGRNRIAAAAGGEGEGERQRESAGANHEAVQRGGGFAGAGRLQESSLRFAGGKNGPPLRKPARAEPGIRGRAASAWRRARRRIRQFVRRCRRSGGRG